MIAYTILEQGDELLMQMISGQGLNAVMLLWLKRLRC